MQHSIYIHIPFCTHRCAYCDFNTYAGVEELIPAYIDALCREVESVGLGAPAGSGVHTIFFGGGTPSLLTPSQIGKVLQSVRSSFRVEAEAEITIEANPGTLTLPALEAMRRAGVNRISMGVQSSNGEELRLLERTHDFGDVLRSVADARRVGFANLNLDLIYGLPEQRLDAWIETLSRIVELNPEHISAYCLTLEHGTPFGKWAARGLMPVPDPDTAAEMYEHAERVLEDAGYGHYEISNWARFGLECRHNLQYWMSAPYFGLGAGAHGYVDGYRYSNVLSLREYVARLLPEGAQPAPAPVDRTRASSGASEGAGPLPWSAAALEHRRQTQEDEMAEFMIMGLRLTKAGVSEGRFQARFGRGVEDVYAGPLARLLGLGLLESIETAPVHGTRQGAADRRLALTDRGRLLGNRVFVEFVN